LLLVSYVVMLLNYFQWQSLGLELGGWYILNNFLEIVICTYIKFIFLSNYLGTIFILPCKINLFFLFFTFTRNWSKNISPKNRCNNRMHPIINKEVSRFILLLRLCGRTPYTHTWYIFLLLFIIITLLEIKYLYIYLLI